MKRRDFVKITLGAGAAIAAGPALAPAIRGGARPVAELSGFAGIVCLEGSGDGTNWFTLGRRRVPLRPRIEAGALILEAAHDVEFPPAPRDCRLMRLRVALDLGELGPNLQPTLRPIRALGTGETLRVAWAGPAGILTA